MQRCAQQFLSRLRKLADIDRLNPLDATLVITPGEQELFTGGRLIREQPDEYALAAVGVHRRQ
ncbi:MAG: hypothetical protein JRG94_19405 [Deltaproteobacteria bacterium]|nr:hypothetical protein [Deltaproteobacteria bacterium]